MGRREAPPLRTPTPHQQEEDDENDELNDSGEIGSAEVDEDLLNMEIPEKPAHTMSNDPDAPRLIITKIVVNNFKSYYGEKVLGPFHKVSSF